MSNRFLATVDSVEVRTAGSFVLGDVATGETVLPVFLAADFDDDGGTANIGAAVIDGQLDGGTEVTYLSRVTDDELGHALVLSTALLADVDDRTAVYVSPPVQSKVAHVTPVDEHATGATEEADVPSAHLWADTRLKEGTTGGQTVLVERTPAVRGPGRLRVVEIIGSPPSTDAHFLAAGTVTSATFDVDEIAMSGVLSTAINMNGVVPTLIADAIAAAIAGGFIDGGGPGDTGSLIDGGGPGA